MVTLTAHQIAARHHQIGGGVRGREQAAGEEIGRRGGDFDLAKVGGVAAHRIQVDLLHKLDLPREVHRVGVEVAQKVERLHEDVLVLHQLHVGPLVRLGDVLLHQLAVAGDGRELQVEVIGQLFAVLRLRLGELVQVGEQLCLLVLQVLDEAAHRLGDLVSDLRADHRQPLAALARLRRLLGQFRQAAAHLGVDAVNLPAENVQVGGAALLADLLLAVGTTQAEGLLAADTAAVHLRGQRLRLLPGDAPVQVEETGERHIVRKGLDAVVGNAVLRPALRALDLPAGVVHQALHAGLSAKGVLAWQQLRIAKAVQADGTGEQLLQLTPRRHCE